MKSNTYEQTLKDKIYDYLIEMNGTIEVGDTVSPENRSMFYQIVKEFIDYDYGKPYNFYLEFSSDYQKLKKIKQQKPSPKEA